MKYTKYWYYSTFMHVPHIYMYVYINFTYMHALTCLLTKYITGDFKRLYNQSSSRDHGTLGHFHSLLGRLSVTVDPKNSVDASLDLLMTTFKGHLVACAFKVIGIEAPNEPVHIPDTVLEGSQKQKQAYISLIASDVVNEITLVYGRHST